MHETSGGGGGGECTGHWLCQCPEVTFLLIRAGDISPIPAEFLSSSSILVAHNCDGQMWMFRTTITGNYSCDINNVYVYLDM